MKSLNKLLINIRYTWAKIFSPYVNNREIMLLSSIINKFIGKFDTEELKIEIVNFIGMLFDADRCFIDDYDPVNKVFITPKYEYLSSGKFMSFKGLKAHEVAPELTKKALRGEEIIFSDTDKYVWENDLVNTQTHRFLKSFRMQSCVYLPIKLNAEMFGMLGIVYIEKRKHFKKEEIDLIRKFCEQIAIAFYQIKINAAFESCAEREILTRKIIQMMGGTLDLDRIKSYFVNQIAECFNADRVGLSLFDDKKEIFLPFDKFSEYRSDPELFSFIGYEWSKKEVREFTEPLKQSREVNFSNLYNYIKENKLENTGLLGLFSLASIGSSINVPVLSGKKVMGFFCIDFVKGGVILSSEEMNFIRVLSDHLGIILHQAELYEKEKQTAGREELMRNLINKIRKTTDIEEIKTLLVTEIGKLFKADRCIIRDYDPKIKSYTTPTPSAEYLSSSDVKSLRDYCLLPEYSNFFQSLSNYKEMLVTSDTEAFIKEHKLEGTAFESFTQLFSIKSGIVQLLVSYEDKTIGLLALHYTKEKVKLSEDNIEFIKSASDQIAIAIHQAELFEKQKQAVEKEQLLREVIQTIRSSLDINEVLSKICDEIGMIFNVGRVSIIQFSDPDDYTKWEIKREYKQKEEFSGIKDVYFDPEISIFWGKKLFEKKTSYLVGNIPESDLPEPLKGTYIKMGLKTLLGIPVSKDEDMWGGIFLSEYEYCRYWTEEEISFIKIIADQVFIAIKQAELYEKLKDTLSKEKSLREAISIVAGTLDLNKIKQEIVSSIAKSINAQRAFIAEFDEDKGKYIPVEYEYPKNPEIKSIIGFDVSKEAPELGYLSIEKPLIVEDTEKYILENGLKGSLSADYLKKYGLRSGFSVPMYYGEKFLGVFVAHYLTRTGAFGEAEIDFARTLANQAGVVLYQAKLYEKIKQTIDRERLLREIISAVRSELDIKKIIKISVEETAKNFNADRCLISEYDKDKNMYIPATKDSEYLQTPETKSLEGFNWNLIPEIGDKFKRGEEEIFSSRTEECEKYINLNMIELAANIRSSLEFYNIEGCAVLPIFYRENFLGVLGLNFRKKRTLCREEIELARTIAGQIGIAIYQAGLYEKEKQTVKRELVLRESIETIRGTLDVQEIKNFLVNSTGVYFKADRCFILEYEFEKDSYLPVTAEYRSSSNIKSVLNKNVHKMASEFALSVKQGENNIIRDAKEFIEANRELKPVSTQFLIDHDIKSDYGFGIFYKNIYYGVLVVEFVKEKKFLTNDELNFFQLLTDQTGVALYQAYLYKKEKQRAERERILREIIETIRGTLDIKEVKRKIVDSVGKAIEADTCTIVDYDEKKNLFLPVKYKYSTSGADDLIKFDIEKNAPEYTYKVKKGEEIIAPDVEKFIEEMNFKNTKSAELFTLIGIKSDYGIPIFYKEKLLGVFIVNYINSKRFLTEDEICFLRTIAYQSGNALYQAELYEKEKATASREKLLREIIQGIRSSLDLEQVLSSICRQLAQAYNVQRATVINYPNPEDYRQWALKKEYKTRADIKGFYDINYDRRAGAYVGKFVLEDEKSLVVDNISESNTPEYYKNAYKELGVKAALSVPIKRGKDKYGIIYLSEYDRYRHWTDEEVSLLQDIADQIYIAINQAELYENERQTSEKNRILKELVGEIRLSQSIDEVYTYIIAKIADLFSADRCFFMEIQQSYLIRYEHLKKAEFKSIKHIQLPEHFLNIFRKTTKSLTPIIIENTRDFSAENKTLQDFFNEYQIRSIIAIPFVRYNMNIKVLGVLSLATETPRCWTEWELEILKAASESVVRVVWEITKIQEIDELRNTFMMTLAHDLQVPLIGEKKAMEYLLSRPDQATIGNYKYFIETIAKDNINMIDMLKSLLEIYNFEAEKKELKPGLCQISELIDSVIRSLEDLVEEKSIPIEIDEQKGLPELYVDRFEIKKVISVLLENALTHAQPGGTVQIKIYQEGRNIITSISDNGMGIPERIQKKLFQRYAMVETIERKIGSGLGLYLSKLIIESHKGKIWYETKVGKGTTFYFSLPIV